MQETQNIQKQAAKPLTKQQWQEVIGPHVPFLDIPYKTLWRRKYMMYLLVRQRLLSKYKQTILGPLWTLILPLISTTIFVVIFTQVLEVPTGNVPPILFYLLGNILWLFISNSITTLSPFLHSYAHLFTKVNIPKQAIAISEVLFGLINMSLQFFVFGAIYIYYYVEGAVRLNYFVLLFPVVIFFIVLFNLGVGYMLSRITLKYRDLQNVYTYLIQYALYATPVIYPLHVLEGTKRTLLELNPLSGLFELARYGFFGEGLISWPLLAYSGSVCVFVFLLGLRAISQANKVYSDIVVGRM